MKATNETLEITENSTNHFKCYKIFKINDSTFMLYCNLKKGSSPIGFNSNLCVKKWTEDGFKKIVDNRFLNLESVDLSADKNFRIKSVSTIFDNFIKFIKKLY